MTDAAPQQVNRFPCGHVDSASYCRECRITLLREQEVDAMAKPATLDEAIAYREVCLRVQKGIERQIPRASFSERLLLIVQNEKALERYRAAKKLVQAITMKHPGTHVVPRQANPVVTPVFIVSDDEDAMPMRNADFLLHVRKLISQGHDGPIPRPKVKNAT